MIQGPFLGELRKAQRFDYGANTRLRGRIYNDTRGLFEDGETVSTAVVIAEEGEFVTTKNGFYLVRWAKVERLAA